MGLYVVQKDHPNGPALSDQLPKNGANLSKWMPIFAGWLCYYYWLFVISQLAYFSAIL